MSVATKFENFNKKILISKSNIETIQNRYEQITKRLNLDFYNSSSGIAHSCYVGSYGRDTEIHTSDIDILFTLPYAKYEQYNSYLINGQSALLQEVRTSLQGTYATSHIKADGQVIGINFNDGISFEIVPCFELNPLTSPNLFTFPDSNGGGKWKKTNPKPEIEAIKTKNNECNKNLKRLCRMTRAWKSHCNVPMGGLLIDTLAYKFLENWKHKDKSYLYYDFMVRDFFEYLKNQNTGQAYWYAVGSNQYICRKGKFEYKAKLAYDLALKAIEYENKEQAYSANLKWKEIFSSKFTG